MSQYTTKNKSSRLQNHCMIKEKDNIISKLEDDNLTLRSIIDHIPANVFWLDKNGFYLGCNKSTANTVGLDSPNQLVGKCNNDLLDKTMADPLNRTNAVVIKTGEDSYLEEKGISSDGSPADYLTKKSPLLNKQGEIVGVIGVSFDITDRKRIETELKIAKEKAEASDLAKSQFLAMMNHELNTPIVSIIGLIDLIKQNQIPLEEKNNIINTIENCTRHLLNLVNEVLDFNRIEKGKSRVRKSPINVSALINEVYNILFIRANEKGLKLNIHYSNKINKAIYSDYGVLLQILLNLAANAIKFTDTGEVSIHANLLYSDKDKMVLEFSIKDTGIGIPVDKLELIFEPFQQLEECYVRQTSRHGTGLGLAIVKMLCQQLDMKINVTSIPNVGSTFSVIGKFDICENTNINSSDIHSAQKIPYAENFLSTNMAEDESILSAKKPRILLVEDDPVIQYIHNKMLEEFKCQVEIIAHGRDVIKSMEEYDLIFVDLSLPDISGFDVIKSLREKNIHRTTPIIALTAHTGIKEKEISLEAGANEFQTKPISREQLKKILIQHIITKK